jgi:pyruvate kinase
MQQKTKIIATIGPSSQQPAVAEKLVRTGVNFFRLNMSHGDHDSHKKTIDLREALEKKTGHTIGIIADLCGPKIRIGDFNDTHITLRKGQTFTLTTERIIGDNERVFINYPSIAKDLSVGARILLDDGKKELVVTKILGTTAVETRVLVGGQIAPRRGVNMPNANLRIAALTAKDKKDVAWGVAQDVDFFAISFVRHKKDILELRALLAKHKSKAQIIAKIETPEAVECIDEIIEASDAVMVARGDLAIEIGAENVPHIQKEIIHKCNTLGKPVITATQMLESMVRNPVPTRAEISDIANAIYDGTDCIMLSEETAVGAYPIETVAMMAKTALRTEASVLTHKRIEVQEHNRIDSISSSVVHIAEDIQATAIVALTETGGTARVISRFRPKQPIFAVTPHKEAGRKAMLSSGVYPLVMPSFKNVTDASAYIRKELKKKKLAKKGQRIIFSAGLPFGTTGSTNMLLVETIG